jgi:alpha-glucosidase
LLAKRRELLPGQPGKRQVWSDLPRVQRIVEGIRATADEFGQRLLVGEVWLPPRSLVMFYGRDLRGLQLPFNFQLIQTRWSARQVGAVIERYEGLLPAGAWPNWVLGNHDRPRIATRVGDAQARVAAMLLLTLRGTPTLYYGDELGMRDAAIAPAQMRDPQGLRTGESRDPERTPMRWDGSAGVGFTTGQPWLPMGVDLATINVAAERADPASMLELYRRLLALRRAEPALSVGEWAPIAATGDLLAYERRTAGRRLAIALNFGRRDQLATLPAGRIALSTHLDREGERVTGPLRLRPNEGVIVDPNG